MLSADDSQNLALIADESSRLGLTVDELLRLLRSVGQGGAVDIGSHNLDAGAHGGAVARVRAAASAPSPDTLVLRGPGGEANAAVSSRVGTDAAITPNRVVTFRDIWCGPNITGAGSILDRIAAGSLCAGIWYRVSGDAAGGVTGFPDVGQRHWNLFLYQSPSPHPDKKYNDAWTYVYCWTEQGEWFVNQYNPSYSTSSRKSVWLGWRRIDGIGCFPGESTGRGVTLSTPASGTTLTPPVSGWLRVLGIPANTGGSITIRDPANNFAYSKWNCGALVEAFANMLPVLAGVPYLVEYENITSMTLTIVKTRQGATV